MFEFIVGVGIGIWIGTIYDCRPYIDFIKGLEKKKKE